MAKRKKRIMRSLTIKELSGVDEPAQIHARALLMKRATPASPDPTPAEFTKNLTFLTGVSNGHAHLFALAEVGGMTWPAGAPNELGHIHPFIVDSEGAIVIGEADGHQHDVDMTEVRAVLDQLLAKKGDGQTATDLLGVPETLPEALQNLSDEAEDIDADMTDEQRREIRERNAQRRDRAEREARIAETSPPKTLLDLDMELERMAAEQARDDETIQAAFVRLIDERDPDFAALLEERDEVARLGATLQ